FHPIGEQPPALNSVTTSGPQGGSLPRLPHVWNTQTRPVPSIVTSPWFAISRQLAVRLPRDGRGNALIESLEVEFGMGNGCSEQTVRRRWVAA
ncbi:hypothetical protein, partial [Sinorhizobium americanum]|uniref:hypothetical protein n=1 Tax=Sinorhizobium americanum TaxID=194963 RepID=UPI001A9EB039